MKEPLTAGAAGVDDHLARQVDRVEQHVVDSTGTRSVEPPRTIVARTADVPDGAPSPKLATSESTTAEPITVRQYIAASPADQEKALRARWATNAAEPTLGKLVSAARETGAENDTVLGIKHCVDGLVRNDAKVLGVFKDLGITDAHLMQEPDRAVNDAIDTCMVMMMAMAANTGS